MKSMSVRTRFFYFERVVFCGMLVIALFKVFLLTGTVHANEKPEQYTFVNHIQPIMETRCFECHGSEFQDGRLRLDNESDALAGGESGNPAIVPGEIIESYIMARILLPDNHANVMPPRREPRLTAEEIITIAHWIAQGARWDALEETAEDVAVVLEDPGTDVDTAEVADQDESVAIAVNEPTEAEATRDDTPETVVSASDDTGVHFAKHIWPIIQESCLECHSERRQQGELRLDSIASIMKGGESHGPSVIPGAPDESPLYMLVTLPENHIDFMPASGAPLTLEQTNLIKEWILAGASFDGWEDPVLTATVIQDEQRRNLDLLYAQLGEGLTPVSEEVLKPIRDMNAIVLPLNSSTPLLRVDLSLLEQPADDKTIALLLPVAAHVTWLNLANSNLTVEGLSLLNQFPRLTRLNLERSSINDTGLLHISGFANLYYLNLYGTEITDAGLSALLNLPELEQIYLWQTAVTEVGAGILREAYSDQLSINMGIEMKADQDAEVQDEDVAA